MVMAYATLNSLLVNIGNFISLFVLLIFTEYVLERNNNANKANTRSDTAKKTLYEYLSNGRAGDFLYHYIRRYLLNLMVLVATPNDVRKVTKSGMCAPI